MVYKGLRSEQGLVSHPKTSLIIDVNHYTAYDGYSCFQFVLFADKMIDIGI